PLHVIDLTFTPSPSIATFQPGLLVGVTLATSCGISIFTATVGISFSFGTLTVNTWYAAVAASPGLTVTCAKTGFGATNARTNAAKIVSGMLVKYFCSFMGRLLISIMLIRPVYHAARTCFASLS